MTIRDARRLGVETGRGIARANASELRKMDKDAALADVMETESDHYRQFSPFEFTAKEFNDSPISERLWEVYEQGVEAGARMVIANLTEGGQS